MKLAALFSGGKDSAFAIYQAKKEGHDITCLLTVFPFSAESHLLHFPNIEITKLQSNSMKIPQIYVKSKSNTKEDEQISLEIILKKAKIDFKIEGLVHGGILSDFQKKIFETLCNKLDLQLVSPIWKKDQKKYMNTLIDSSFCFVIASVSSDGLDDSWLGKKITHKELKKLEILSQEHGFNLSFEGGEAETLVLDCPLFSHPLAIKESKKNWDGYRGSLEIKAELDYS